MDMDVISIRCQLAETIHPPNDKSYAVNNQLTLLNYVS